MNYREERIARLASTLKSSGIAKSDSQARMLAEDMIGVEDNVQKKFDEEHSKAQEFLKTAKNLRQPIASQLDTNAAPSISNVSGLNGVHTGEVDVGVSHSSSNVPSQTSSRDEVYTDIDFGKKPLKDLLNPAIEEMKSNVMKSFEEKPAIIAEPAAIPKEPVEKQLTQSTANDLLSEVPVQEIKNSVSEEVALDAQKKADIKSEDSITPIQEETVDTASEMNKTTNDCASDAALPQKLDTQRLASLMEEDGPMEEHTREIKEKPKDTKPKEDYVENSVDLSSIFGVKK